MKPDPNQLKSTGGFAARPPNLELLEELLDSLHAHLGHVGAPKSMLARIHDMREPIRYAREGRRERSRVSKLA